MTIDEEITMADIRETLYERHYPGSVEDIIGYFGTINPTPGQLLKFKKSWSNENNAVLLDPLDRQQASLLTKELGIHPFLWKIVVTEQITNDGLTCAEAAVFWNPEHEILFKLAKGT